MNAAIAASPVRCMSPYWTQRSSLTQPNDFADAAPAIFSTLQDTQKPTLQRAKNCQRTAPPTPAE